MFSLMPRKAGFTLLLALTCATASAGDRANPQCLKLIQNIADGNLTQASRLIQKGVSASCVHFDDHKGYYFPLQFAALEKNRAAVELLLRAGADINQTAPNDTPTALHFAVESSDDDESFVGFLLAKGASVDAAAGQGSTPLIRAAKWGYTRVARLLIANGANVNAVDWFLNTTPALEALDQGHLQLFDELIKAGGQFEILGKYANDVFSIAIRNCRIADFRHLLNRYPSEATQERMTRALSRLSNCATPYGNETREGRISNPDLLPLARELISLGADVRAGGSGGFYQAASNYRIDLVTFYLDRGVDPDTRDGRGRTALCDISHQRASEETMLLLLSRGANPDCGTDETLLHRAVNAPHVTQRSEARLELIRTLLASGVNREARYFGMTALEMLRKMKSPWPEAERLFK